MLFIEDNNKYPTVLNMLGKLYKILFNFIEGRGYK